MHLFSRRFSFLASALALLLVTSCSSGGGGSDSSSSGSTEVTADADGLRTTCGAVVDGKRFSPISTDRGEPVTLVEVIDSNLLALNNGSENFNIKLHALGNTRGFDNSEARKTLAALATEQLYFFNTGCTEDVGGGAVQVGQVISASGKSFGEVVIRDRIGGVIEDSGACDQAVISNCFKGIVDPSLLEPPTDGETPVEGAGEVTNFLWKPNSESPYNPGGVSILLNPCNARVFINGEEIRDYGGTNGRCVTARSAQSGCSYGSNIKLEAIDAVSGKPFTFNGATSLTIPDGCSRFEFNAGVSSGGSSSVECSVAPASFQYRPSAPECSGNAAVVLSGELQGFFSAQLRLPDGGDRLDEDCADRSCSPYKAQGTVDGAGNVTVCFGAPGDAVLMTDVAYSTVKLAADDSDPGRYCIPDPTLPVN